MNPWLEKLNPEQGRAVMHSEGPLLILAGAGSGKTTVLVARTGRMIAEKIANPTEIAVLTFTNKAARELKHRVENRLGPMAKGLWAGTFHSFGLQILRKNHKAANLPPSFGVIDQNDSVGILRELLKETKVVGKDKYDLDKILELIHRNRTGQAPKNEAFDEYHEVAEMLLPKYIKKLDLMGVVDFEALLLKPLELFKEHPEILEGIQQQLRYLMIDEFQDTNDVQMRLIDQITKKNRNLCVVGDDDQSIYGWRGAQVRNILDFPKTHPGCEVVKLERNYRSSSNILEVANRLIEKNKHRHGKVLKPQKALQGAKKPEIFQIENEEDESEFILREIKELRDRGVKASEIAVLYRSNSQGGLIESLLRQNQIPYSVSGGTAFFDRKEIKDILAYLRFSVANNDVSLRRIINTPARGIGDTSVERLIEYAKIHNVSFVKACHQALAAQGSGVPEKSMESLRALFSYLRSLPGKIMDPKSADTPGQNMIKALQEIHYRDYLYSSSSEPHVAEKKWLLVEIFSRVLDAFARKGGVSEKTLREFIDSMELRDEPESEKQDQVSLMTLHACKGLEFPHVYIVGVEEDLLPHRTLGSDVDEERRLFYVGITRAQESLVMSYCKSRTRYGGRKPVSISRFLLEIPKDLVLIHLDGYRPVTAIQRQSLVADFLSRKAPGTT